MSLSSPLAIAQITDIHLFADANGELLGLPTAKSFQAVLEQLQKLPQPDMLLLTGDLSQDETPESYQRLAVMLTPLGIPTYWLPGNHDCVPVMQQVLNRSPIFPQKSFQMGGWHFILLNSSERGCVHGQLSLLELEWLERQLQLVGEPTLIALHHPPIKINSDWLDNINLRNSEELFAIVDRYPQVRLVVCGHVHQQFDCWRGKVRYLTSPSSCIQFKSESAKFTLDERGPGFRLLKLYPDGTFETKVEWVAIAHQLDLAASGY